MEKFLVQETVVVTSSTSNSQHSTSRSIKIMRNPDDQREYESVTLTDPEEIMRVFRACQNALFAYKRITQAAVEA